MIPAGSGASAPASAHAPPAEPGSERALSLLARGAACVVLVTAPLVMEWAYQRTWLLFLGAVSLSGAASWLRARKARSRGAQVPAVPGWRLLLALNVLVLLQLLPLPPRVLWALNPGSYEFHSEDSGAAEPRAWPVSVSPPRTRRGLLFLAALSLFYTAVWREFRSRERARFLAGVIVSVALLTTFAGLVQRASSRPGYAYGLWRAGRADIVFGPYGNRSYYAGHAVMALPLVLGLAFEALAETRRSWRRRGFAALGEPAASLAVLRAAVALFIAAGVLSAGSRTAVIACAAAPLAVVLAFRRHALHAAAIVVPLALASLLLVDLEWFSRSFTRAAFDTGRAMIWRDMTGIVRDFPLLGVGWNALGPAFRWRYQTAHLWGQWDQAHNEYFDVLLQTGLCGAALAGSLFFLLYRAGFRAAEKGAFGVGLLGALAANATTNLADFNLQVPANAATFVAIAGLTMAYTRAGNRPDGTEPAGPE